MIDQAASADDAVVASAAQPTTFLSELGDLDSALAVGDFQADAPSMSWFDIEGLVDTVDEAMENKLEAFLPELSPATADACKNVATVELGRSIATKFASSAGTAAKKWRSATTRVAPLPPPPQQQQQPLSEPNFSAFPLSEDDGFGPQAPIEESIFDQLLREEDQHQHHHQQPGYQQAWGTPYGPASPVAVQGRVIAGDWYTQTQSAHQGHQNPQHQMHQHQMEWYRHHHMQQQRTCTQRSHHISMSSYETYFTNNLNHTAKTSDKIRSGFERLVTAFKTTARTSFSSSASAAVDKGSKGESKTDNKEKRNAQFVKSLKEAFKQAKVNPDQAGAVGVTDAPAQHKKSSGTDKHAGAPGPIKKKGKKGTSLSRSGSLTKSSKQGLMRSLSDIPTREQKEQKKAFDCTVEGAIKSLLSGEGAKSTKPGPLQMPPTGGFFASQGTIADSNQTNSPSDHFELAEMQAQAQLESRGWIFDERSQRGSGKESGEAEPASYNIRDLTKRMFSPQTPDPLKACFPGMAPMRSATVPVTKPQAKDYDHPVVRCLSSKF